jgi:hypothetical protein
VAPQFAFATDPGKIPDKFGNTKADNAYVRFGNSEDAELGYNTTQTPDALFLGLSSDSRNLVIGEKADKAYDFAHAQQTNPTIYVQSAAQSATQWISISHNGTNGLIDVGAGVVQIPDGIDVDAGTVQFEGSTADTSETILTVADPTADRTVTLPDQTGTALLSTAAQDAANSIKGVANGFEFEGETADTSETTLSVVDPTGDRTISIPNDSGTVLLSTAAQDAANSIKGVANGLEFEGSAADTSETTLTITNPTADRTVTVPDASGTVILGGNTTITAGANTACNTTCGSATKCIAGQDAGASNVLVACSSATADVCICSTN